MGLCGLDGENSEQVFVEAQDALHLLGDARFVRVVDDEIVSFAVLADGVGERAQPPGFGAVDRGFGFFQVLLCLFSNALGLGGREVLAQDEDGFVVGHGFFCFFLWG